MGANDTSYDDKEIPNGKYRIVCSKSLYYIFLLNL